MLIEAPNHDTAAGAADYVALEQLIADNLADLFPGVNIVGCYPFRVTRDMDLEILEDEAADGREGLDLARTVRHDLVLLDLSMPATDGIDVLKQLKRQRPKTPVVILTLHNEDQFAIRALKRQSRTATPTCCRNSSSLT